MGPLPGSPSGVRISPTQLRAVVRKVRFRGTIEGVGPGIGTREVLRVGCLVRAGQPTPVLGQREALRDAHSRAVSDGAYRARDEIPWLETQRVDDQRVSFPVPDGIPGRARPSVVGVLRSRQINPALQSSSSIPSKVWRARWAPKTADRSRPLPYGTAPPTCRSITTMSTSVRRC